MKLVQGWGVFRNDKLVSSILGIPEQDAREMSVALEKFMRGESKYIAKAIPGKRIPIETTPMTTEGK